MKTASSKYLATFALASLLIAGCGQQGSMTGSEGSVSSASSISTSADSSSSSQAISAGSDSTVSSASSNSTYAAFLSEHYRSFEEFDQGIRSGKRIPESLRLTVGETIDGYVTDEATIIRMWEALSEVQIDVQHPTKSQDGTYISFDFDSGREVIPFSFRTSSFAEYYDGTSFPVKDPAEIDRLVDELTEATKEEMPKAGDRLVARNDAYFWDADGDGTLEHTWFDFYDNGDEAPSGMVVRLFNTKYDVSDYIDFVKTVDEVWLKEDEKGPYIFVKFLTEEGYAYNYTIRLVDGALAIERAE